MNLTFKRGTKSVLDNTNITPNMVYFTTDLNAHAIYMDDENGNRHKIFGFNDNDIITSVSDISENTFFDNTQNNDILRENQIATNGDVTNKYAIGMGYYNNVIGEDINNILYNNAPTIKSSISYLQNNARSKLSLIWTNSSPSTTWTEDLSGYQDTSSENFDINLSSSYLGYIILIQSHLDDTNTIYPITLFGLPSSIVNGHGAYREKTVDLDEETENDSSHVNATLTFTLNNMVLNIKKDGTINSGSFAFHNFLIPIAVYGWRL